MSKALREAAYMLCLPVESKIHLVFHVSQLKRVLGAHHQVSVLPPVCDDLQEVLVQPEAILATRYTDTCSLELLITWWGLPSHDDLWVLTKEFKREFSSFLLENKLHVEGGRY